ncbi:MAG: type pantothenate kinase, partial [Devosia sp.]|nr:type pantothenate kinase [Devosia sp.]
MAETWLLFDIGNTHTVAGLVQSDGRQLAEVRFRTDAQCTADEYRILVRQLFQDPLGHNVWETADRAIISTVVPALEATVTKACDAIPVLFINAQLRREFELDLPHPEQLGADRLCNVAGALGLVKGPLLIVDAGTATTFCLVDHRQAYIGGAI